MGVDTAAAVATQVSPWIGPGIQAGAIVVSALGVAFLILTNRSISRRKAILDLIVLSQTDGDMLEARQRFVSIKEDGNLQQWAAKKKLASQEAADIRFILNMYEAVAIGIKKNAYDGDIYKDWYRTTVIKDWMAVKDFVAVYQQEHNAKIYENFEKLAKEWATDEERKHT